MPVLVYRLDVFCLEDRCCPLKLIEHLFTQGVQLLQTTGALSLSPLSRYTSPCTTRPTRCVGYLGLCLGSWS